MSEHYIPRKTPLDVGISLLYDFTEFFTSQDPHFPALWLESQGFVSPSLWHTVNNCDCLWDSFPGGSEGKASAYNAGDLGSIPG